MTPFINILPREVIINIYEFSAERPIKKIQSEIIRKGFLSSYKHLQDHHINNHKEDSSISFSEMSDDFVLEYDISKMIKALYNCDCCKRHKFKKPRNIYDFDWIHEQADDCSRDSKSNNCYCYCRINSRRMFRIVNSNPLPSPGFIF
tara:strand:+ start:208 stop:648 length:441 start_codon:yes stop_codon:yes gene_type:complete